MNYISIHSDCGTDSETCEINVDTYLDEFCAQARSTTNSATSAAIITELPHPTSTITNTHTAQTATVTGTQSLAINTRYAMLVFTMIACSISV